MIGHINYANVAKPKGIAVARLPEKEKVI